MKNNNVTTAWVVGADLDRACVQGLIEGDKVLCEMNGARVFSSYDNPMVADEPWVVVSNDESELVLHHKSKDRTVRLPYETLLKLAPKEPAVFLIKDKRLSPGPIYCLLQFAQHRMDASKVAKVFPMAFDPANILREARKEVIEKIVETLATFSHPGWGYRSVCRFALRSNVRAKTIGEIKDQDWKSICALPDETLVKIMREMNWIPYLLSAGSVSDPVAVLAERPYEAPNDVSGHVAPNVTDGNPSQST
jgi:hypothetical protein